MHFNRHMQLQCFPDGHEVSKYFHTMLQKAQMFFGERDIRYHTARIYFSQESRPQIFLHPKDGIVDIRLTICAEKDISKACYQLSHEVTHLIVPNIVEIHGRANNLEEGTACWFSQYCMDNDLGKYGKNFGDPPRDYKDTVFRDPNYKTVYREVYEAVKPLFNQNQFFIKNLREQIIGNDKRFHRICDKSIKKLFPELIDSKIKFLLDRFNR